MRVEEFLDLAWVYVLAAANNHILDASDNIDITFCIHCSEIAGVHPVGTVNGVYRGLFVVPVAEHDAVAACAKLASCANRHNLLCCRVNNFNLKVRVNLPDSANTLIEGCINASLR